MQVKKRHVRKITFRLSNMRTIKGREEGQEETSWRANRTCLFNPRNEVTPMFERGRAVRDAFTIKNSFGLHRSFRVTFYSCT